MRIRRLLITLAVLLMAVSSQGNAGISENSRQGVQPIFSGSGVSLTPPLSASHAGFRSTIRETRVECDERGNMQWPDKPGHGVPPCRELDLGDLLDRLEGKYTFGGPIHDFWHHGRHFAKVLTPYLYTGRRLDAFSQTYNNRNRQYNPRFGRFVSRDPIGFDGGNNLWGYCNNNPLRYTDPTGQNPILLAIGRLLLSFGISALSGELTYLNAVDVQQWEQYARNMEWMNLISSIERALQKLESAPNPNEPQLCQLKRELEGLREEIKKQPDKDPPSEPVTVYHGSRNNYSWIMLNGLDPNNLPVWVSRDIRAARDAISYSRTENQNFGTRNSGVVGSRIPKLDFNVYFLPAERTYTGFDGSLNSTEIILKTSTPVVIFNQNMIR